MPYGIFAQGLYGDIRQLLNYVSITHGSTYRKVALSGLMDSMHRVSSIG